jgi:hypothetical protein
VRRTTSSSVVETVRRCPHGHAHWAILVVPRMVLVSFGALGGTYARCAFTPRMSATRYGHGQLTTGQSSS